MKNILTKPKVNYLLSEWIPFYAKIAFSSCHVWNIVVVLCRITKSRISSSYHARCFSRAYQIVSYFMLDESLRKRISPQTKSVIFMNPFWMISSYSWKLNDQLRLFLLTRQIVKGILLYGKTGMKPVIWKRVSLFTFITSHWWYFLHQSFSLSSWWVQDQSMISKE
jgi:hypothetical protein